MQKITPFLWFNNQAEEAVKLYTSLFKNSRVKEIARYDEAGAKVSGQPMGTVMTIAFELEGQEFTALNGGPHYTFSPAISFVIDCETQQEVDHFWDKLSVGGVIEQCGWLRDQYGVSWQIVPVVLTKMLQDRDAAKAQRVMQAMLKMKKLDIAALQKAYYGQ